MAQRTSAPFPLSHIVALDLSRNIGGSQAARLLAEAGACVVKVGDPDLSPLADFPTWTGSPPARGVLWRYVNQHKNIWLIEPSRHKEQLQHAIGLADVIVHDMTDEQAHGRGLEDELLRRINPSIVSLAVTPFGATGPRSGHTAGDLALMATSGIMYSTPGFPDFVEDTSASPPLRPSVDMAELIGGVLGAAACLEALIFRLRTGRGEKVDVAVQEVLASLLSWDYGLWNYGGILAGRREFRAGLAPNAYLPCADGWLVLVSFMEHHWSALVDIMGNPEWANSPLFTTMIDRGENWDALRTLFEMWLREQNGRDLMAKCQKRGIPTCAVLEVGEAFDNEQVRARQFLVPFNEGRVPGRVFLINHVRPALPLNGLRSVDFERLINASESPRLPRTASILRQPLEGFRVIDFGQIVAMPLAAQWMGFMGAEVIQVESRVNLPSRKFQPIIGEPPENNSALYNHVNRNKKSVTINLRTTKGIELAKQLISTADIVCENFSAGTMEKLGLGYEDLRKVKPDIIMVSLSAFGRSGPWTHYNALHSGVMVLSGLAAVTGYDQGYPRLCGSLLPDGLAACYATLAMAQALYHRLLSGEGQHVELAMSEVVQSVLAEPIFEYLRFGEARPRLGNRSLNVAPHNIYPAQGEDRWIAIGAYDDEEWRALTRAIGRTDLADDSRFISPDSRLAHSTEIDSAVEEWTSRVSVEKGIARLQEEGVPAGAVYNVRDLLEDEHLIARGFIEQIQHPEAGCHPMPGRPWRTQSAARPTIRHAPLLGEDNAYVFRELLRLSEGRVRELEKQGVIS